MSQEAASLGLLPAHTPYSEAVTAWAGGRTRSLASPDVSNRHIQDNLRNSLVLFRLLKYERAVAVKNARCSSPCDRRGLTNTF